MAARQNKSRKQSAGKVSFLSLPEEFILYLDENLCNSRSIQETLTKLQVKFERHLAHFSPGTLDESWLPLVGSKGWVLLTADKRIRYNLLEKRALEKHAVREFAFASGNLSGQDMANALEVALPKMMRFSRRFNPPFVASITRIGEVHLRWSKK
jgi:hypothetical protein